MGERLQGEAAAVAEGIEYIGVPGQGADQQTILPLVEVMAGLVTMGQIDFYFEVVLDAGDARFIQRAAQQSAGDFQAFDFQHVGIGTLVERTRAGQAHEAVGDGITPAARAGAGGLQHQHIAKAIDDETGQAVGFGMHQAHTAIGAGRQQAFTHGDGGREAGFKEGRVDDGLFPPGPDAHADIGHRVPGAMPEEAAVLGEHADGVADLRLAQYLVDGARKDPGMTAQQ